MIEVGEYVRTKKGQIDKVKEICKHEAFIKKFYRFYNMRMLEDEEIEKTIVNHSKNIIDLIEVGDYVNGDRMDIVEKDENGHVYYLQNIELPSINKNEIKTILTKEQYEANCYKVKEEIC